MSRQWAVFMAPEDNHGTPAAWGPFPEMQEAGEFAAWVTAAIDPARVIPLRNPVGEMLGEWRARLAGEEAGNG